MQIKIDEDLIILGLKGKEKEELQVEDILSKFNEISIECGN